MCNWGNGNLSMTFLTYGDFRQTTKMIVYTVKVFIFTQDWLFLVNCELNRDQTVLIDYFFTIIRLTAKPEHYTDIQPVLDRGLSLSWTVANYDCVINICSSQWSRVLSGDENHGKWKRGLARERLGRNRVTYGNREVRF